MKKRKIIYICLIVFFALCILASGTVILVKLWPDKPDFNEYKNQNSSQSESQAEPELPDNPIDFPALLQQSTNVCGYIKVDGTAVDYPVMRSSEMEKEDFYLDHTWLGKSKSAGAIYMQRYNNKDFSDKCTVLYGHNMMNGSMFGTLKRFRNGNFFRDNRHITIYAPQHIYTYEIISAFVYDDRHIINSFNFDKKDDYQLFLDECTNPKSLTKQVFKDLVPTTDDKLVVLSTCTSNDRERYLVVGCLISDVKTK